MLHYKIFYYGMLRLAIEYKTKSCTYIFFTSYMNGFTMGFNNMLTDG